MRSEGEGGYASRAEKVRVTGTYSYQGVPMRTGCRATSAQQRMSTSNPHAIQLRFHHLRCPFPYL